MIKRTSQVDALPKIKAMKLFNSTTHAWFLLLLFLPYTANARELESGTASARTTPQFAKAVAKLYCDFAISGVSPSDAIAQARSEVEASASKPEPFNERIFQATLKKAINEKGFCPSMPKLKEKAVAIPQTPKTCDLSPSEINLLEQTKRFSKRGKNCTISIIVH